MSVDQEEKDFIASMFMGCDLLSLAQKRVLSKLSDKWVSANALHETQEVLNKLVKLGLAERKRSMSNGLGAVPNPVYRLKK